MSRFEKPLVHSLNIDGEERFSSAVDQAYYNFFEGGSERTPELRKNRNRKMSLANMDEFEKVYPKEKIKKDQQKVKDLRLSSSEDFVSKESDIFEFLMSDSKIKLIENLSFQPTEEYDDRMNHTDAWTILKTLDSNGKASFPKIAFDFTTAVEEDVLDKKIEKIAGEISLGKLTNLKYVKRNVTKNGQIEETFGLERVPRVIINCSKTEVEKLCEIVNALAKKEDTNFFSEGKYSFQVGFLEESLAQLQKQAKCLEQGSGTKMIILENIQSDIKKNNPKMNPKELSTKAQVFFNLMNTNLNSAIKALKEKLEELQKNKKNSPSQTKSHLLPKINPLNPNYESIISARNQGGIRVWRAA